MGLVPESLVEEVYDAVYHSGESSQASTKFGTAGGVVSNKEILYDHDHSPGQHF